MCHFVSKSELTILPAPLSARSYATSSEPDLKETLKGLIPAKRELLKKVKAHGDKVIGEVKIENTLGGMRYGWTIIVDSEEADWMFTEA